MRRREGVLHTHDRPNWSSPVRWLQVALIAGALILLVTTLPTMYYGEPEQTEPEAIRNSRTEKTSSSTSETAASPKDFVYGLMMDAGSTGTRMHNYVFRRNAKTAALELETEYYDKIDAGVSKFKDSPAEAGPFLEPLLQKARDVIPAEKRARTPLYLYATAGLRLIGEEKANLILDAMRTHLRESGFWVPSDDAVSIMSGVDEGLFSWLTINFLMDRTNGGGEETATVMDLGGGSTQVTFFPRGAPAAAAGKSPSDEAIADYIKPLHFGGRKFDVYTHSFLGYGLYEFQRRLFDAARSSGENDSPCIPAGDSIEIKVGLDNAKHRFKGRGHFGACVREVEPLLRLNEACDYEAGCTLGGEYFPSLPDGPVVAFAYYWDKTVGVGLNGDKMSPASVRQFGERVCSMPIEAVRKEFPKVPNGNPDELCFTSAYIYSLMTKAWKIPESEPRFTIVQRLKGIEFGWALGAMFAKFGELNIA